MHTTTKASSAPDPGRHSDTAAPETDTGCTDSGRRQTAPRPGRWSPSLGILERRLYRELDRTFAAERRAFDPEGGRGRKGY